MSVLIKGLEMPKDSTFNIVHIYGDGHVAMPFFGKGMQIVPGIEAVELPPHGRLIDADAFCKQIANDRRIGGIVAAGIISYIEHAHTIVPAEGENADDSKL